ncbi:hypothetical protein ACIP79_40075 [Streptomyces sp. NPDC088747]|uniref:hypothetical protein n=1 Tax=Streptomyces sp. NPDC088747 TaxID=3365886 RepID=UPI00381FDE08
MRTIMSAAVLSAGLVLGGSASALAHGWDGQGDDDGQSSSACWIAAGAGDGKGFYTQGCQRTGDEHEDRDGFLFGSHFGGRQH